MPKFIKNIVDRVNLASRKGLTPFFSPDQIIEEVHSESMNLWKALLKEFESTQLISVYLDPLRAKETVTLTAGAGTLVTSKTQYKTGIMLPTSDINVEQVAVSHWPDRVNNSVKVPSATYPICRIDNADIIVRPSALTSVIVHFVKVPTKPVYAFSIDDDDYVYSDGSSSDFEWPEVVHDQIMNRVLANLGISMRAGELIQYSNIEQQKEGK